MADGGATVYLAWAAAAAAAAGAVYQGQVASANAKSQAKADEYNALEQAEAARQASLQAGSREEAARSRARQFLGKQRAAIAQTGAGFGGTYAGVIDQSAANLELEALQERYGGDVERRGLLAQAEGTRYGARVSRRNARYASTAGFIGAGAELLGGASNAYGANARINTARGGG